MARLNYLDTLIDNKADLSWGELQNMAIDGRMPDKQNPALLFALTPTGLLKRIAAGEINLDSIAYCELRSRKDLHQLRLSDILNGKRISVKKTLNHKLMD